jgi:organic radical activating enzyme
MNISSIKNDNFTINAILSNFCNYNCNYCPPRLKNGSNQNISAQEYITFFSFLFQDNPQIFDYSKRKISFTGGEPSLYPDIDKLLVFFKENNFENAMLTNGSTKLDFWNNNVSNIDILYLSFHPRYGNYRHVTDIINIFKQNNHRVVMNLLMDKDYWDRAMEAAQYFESKDITIIYKGVLDKLGDSVYVDYNAEQINFLTQNTIRNIELEIETDAVVSYSDGTSEYFDGQKIISNNLNYLSGYSCDIGKSSLVIKWNGIVAGGQCSQVVFGNLSENKNLRVNLMKDSTICQTNKCACIYDLKINKYRS